MAEETKVTGEAPAEKSRRVFVKTAAQVAVTAPAVAMLMQAKPAAAAILPYNVATSLHILDDFTYGNEEEDIDACKGSGNTQDDTAGGPGCTNKA
jgi:hypothetical protein